MKIPQSVLIALLGSTLILGLLCGGAAVAQRAYAQRILPGVTIGAIDVSGLTTDEAIQTLENHVNHFLEAGIPVTFSGEEKYIPLMPHGASDPDLVYELAEIPVQDAVAQAYAIGRSQDPLQTFFAPLWFATLGKADIPLQVQFAETRIANAVQAAFPTAESPGTPTDFVVSIKQNKLEINVIEAVTGSMLDMQKFFTQLIADASDLTLSPIALERIERSSNVSLAEAQALVADAKRALERAPYTLTFTSDSHQTFTYEITQKNLAIWLKPERTNTGNVRLGLDVQAMQSLLDEMHADIDIAPQNATFTVENNKVSEFIPSKDGMVISDEQLLESLVTAFVFESSEPPTRLNIPVVRKAPEIPVANINSYGITEVLGVGYSSFKGSPANRRENIRHGAEKLNGTLIAPGETLSLLEKLRPFTTSDGYLPELVIKGDEIVPEIGGGLCQIGTTTFRAAMNAGLHISERRNHSLVVSYYNDPANGNPGTDATIYDPAPDLKITNDTNNYILLATEVNTDTSELFFTFWGTSDGRMGSYTPPEVTSWTGYGARITKETTSLAPGTTRCQSPHPGATTSFDYNIIWADGTVTTQNFASTYRSLPEVCLVGVHEEALPEDPPLIEEVPNPAE